MSTLLRSFVNALHSRPAVVAEGVTFGYGDILSSAVKLSDTLNNSCPQPKTTPALSRQQQQHHKQDFNAQPRIAIMCSHGPEYVAATLATWLHRGIAVPLSLDHPDRELEYVLGHANCDAVIATQHHTQRIHTLHKPPRCSVVEIPLIAKPAPHNNNTTPHQDDDHTTQYVSQKLEQLHDDDGALMVYTSGTTGRPKGVVHTHNSINAQITSLSEAWQYKSTYRTLHTLPLHHVHGIVNALYMPLATQGTVEFMKKFSPRAVWDVLMRRTKSDIVDVFMGVPTMYALLLNCYTLMKPPTRYKATRCLETNLKLAISGSAAAPLPILTRWKEISGEYPLERYGMTETGMILGNPIQQGGRRPGTVGVPFPGVHVKIVSLVDNDGTSSSSGDVQQQSNNNNDDDSSVAGELRVKSNQLFTEYFNNAEATAEAFDEDGWFKTGDTATYDTTTTTTTSNNNTTQQRYIKLLGRTSVDIIKRGGYKISALDIESVLLEHPDIAECAVMGLPDEIYGEAIAAVVALKKDTSSSNQTTTPLTIHQLTSWASSRLPTYQLPTLLKLVDIIPRNAMGKINKKSLKAELFGSGGGVDGGGGNNKVQQRVEKENASKNDNACPLDG